MANPPKISHRISPDQHTRLRQVLRAHRPLQRENLIPSYRFTIQFPAISAILRPRNGSIAGILRFTVKGKNVNDDIFDTDVYEWIVKPIEMLMARVGTVY